MKKVKEYIDYHEKTRGSMSPTSLEKIFDMIFELES